MRGNGKKQKLGCSQWGEAPRSPASPVCRVRVLGASAGILHTSSGRGGLAFSPPAANFVHQHPHPHAHPVPGMSPCRGSRRCHTGHGLTRNSPLPSPPPPTPAMHILWTFNWLQLLTSTDTGNLPVRKIMNRFNTNSARKQTRLPAPLRPPGARRRCSRRGFALVGTRGGEPSIPTGPLMSSSPRGPHVPPETVPAPLGIPRASLEVQSPGLGRVLSIIPIHAGMKPQEPPQQKVPVHPRALPKHFCPEKYSCQGVEIGSAYF